MHSVGVITPITDQCCRLKLGVKASASSTPLHVFLKCLITFKIKTVSKTWKVMLWQEKKTHNYLVLSLQHYSVMSIIALQRCARGSYKWSRYYWELGCLCLPVVEDGVSLLMKIRFSELCKHVFASKRKAKTGKSENSTWVKEDKVMLLQ